MKKWRRRMRREPRRAFLLLLVTIVVAMAALAAANFSDAMLTSHKASRILGSQLQARMMSESGLQMVRLLLAYDKLTLLEMGGTWDNPQKFQAINIVPDLDPARRGNVTIIAPSLDQTGLYSGFRYGLQNESAKLNLNALAQIDSLSSSATGAMSALGMGASSGGTSGGATSGSSVAAGITSSAGTSQLASSQTEASLGLGTQMLLALPGMTEEISDAILDWMDADDEPRPYGAEYDYYQQLTPPYQPANGPLISIEQLLLVRGVTPQLLFGYDADRNGMLDGGEQTQATLGVPFGQIPGSQATTAAATSTSSTSSEGVETVQPDPMGWAAYMTLHSAEKNVAFDGTARVNINSDDLATLKSDLETVLNNESWVSFILQYRISGQPPSGAGSPLQLLATAAAASKQSADGMLGQQLSQLGNAQSPPAGGQQPQTQPWDASLMTADLSTQQGQVKFNQILDLFGATATVGQGGTPYASPFGTDALSMASALPMLMDKLTTVDSPTIPGRINILECPRAIMLGIPGMTSEIVDQIIQARNDGSESENRKFETWIAVEGFVTLDQMRGLEPLITCGGTQQRVSATVLPVEVDLLQRKVRRA